MMMTDQQARSEGAIQTVASRCIRAWCLFTDHGSTPEYHTTPITSMVAGDDAYDANPVRVGVYADVINDEPAEVWLTAWGEPIRFDLDKATELARTILDLVKVMGGAP